MDRFAKITGRQYRLFEYVGHPEAERVIVAMGSGCDVTHEYVEYALKQGEKVGVLKVRLYRPFAIPEFVRALPASVKKLAVLDRSKEPGAPADPMYLDVLAALRQGREEGHTTLDPVVVGGRYGLSSKEFTPAMVKAVFDELAQDRPKNHFTVGIVDDVSHSSLTYDPAFDMEPTDVTRALFYGLGADGTVGANKNSIKIIGEETPNYGQGYFVYDSKKSGAITICHLRFGPRPIRCAYLVDQGQLHRLPPDRASSTSTTCSTAAVPGATFLLNTPYGPDAGLGHPAAGGPAADHREEAQVLRDRRLRGGQGHRHGRAHQHHHADLLLRHLRRAAPRGGHRARSRRPSRRPTARRATTSSRRTSRPWTQTLAHLHEVKVPASRHRHPQAARPWCPTRRRTSSSASPPS